ncbi:hypothetical protein V1498_02680 [Peribacillus sp. SCS-26]|uniref:hypothetical protein n=1 Tax=Paraperibacillus marinus TaxID=3115295 RepID=UPI003906AD0D
MKKIMLLSIALVIVLAGGVWSYFAYKKNDAKDAVHDYLIQKGADEREIKTIEPFIANLPGDRNVMVAVKLDKDEKTYYYFKDSDDGVVLESYTLNGQEYVQ